MYRIWVDGSVLNSQDKENRIATCRLVTETGIQMTIDLGDATNNMAELEGIRYGLQFAVDNKIKEVCILTDSKCALSWLERGPSEELEPEKIEAIQNLLMKIAGLVERLKKAEVKWVTGKEQRADFGRKRR